MVDARIVRTRAALHSAIIRLASQKAVPSVTVSELAELAGINRVTFYKHFDTPAETLASALQLFLDPTRERFISGYAELDADPAEILVTSIDEVLDHIQEHRRLYELSIAAPHDGTVPNVLADHFTETLRQYLARRQGLQPTPPAYDSEIVARFFATGLVGAIKAWVLGGYDDRKSFHDSVLSLLPTWWFPERP